MTAVKISFRLNGRPVETVAAAHHTLLDLLRDETLREIAVMRIEGYSVEEIATKLGIGMRSIERKLQLIRTKWSREIDNE